MEVLKDRKPEVVRVGSDELDLLVKLKGDLIGFVTLGGAPEEEYGRAFKRFQSLYSSRIREWQGLDPVMVLIRTNAEPRWDEFYNRVQIDPHFCRKFVVSAANGTSLQSELEHLPFAPIKVSMVAGHTRPVDAQTLLMAGGLKAELAKRLVKPYTPDISTVVAALLRDGLPEWRPTRGDTEKLRELQGEHVASRRLRNLVVRGFRAYREQSFELDADIVVVYGPNGFGKTSFFDAIDFLLTGGVGRLEDRLSRRASARSLVHLDALDEGASVRADVELDGQQTVLTRRSGDSTHLWMQSAKYDTKAALLKLLDLPLSAAETRVERLVALFRATHIFGQEYQALTGHLSTKSELDAEVVSRMLALQDYVEAARRVEIVQEDVRKRIAATEAEIREDRQLADLKRAEKKDLEGRAKTAETPERLLATGRELVTRIREHVRAVLELPQAVSPALSRMWRGALEAEIHSVVEKEKVVAKLTGKPTLLEAKRTESARLTARVTASRARLEKARREHSEVESKANAAKRELESRLLEQGRVGLEKVNLEWLSHVQAGYAKKKAEAMELEHALQEKQTNLRRMRTSAFDVAARASALQNEVEASRSALAVCNKDLSRLAEVESGLANWVATEARLREIGVGLEQGLIFSAELTARAKKTQEAVASSLTAVVETRKHLETLRRSQSEFQNLIDQVVVYVSDPTCPVCGSPHLTREELLSDIQEKRGIVPAELAAAQESFSRAEARYAAKAKESDGIERELGECHRTQESLREEQGELQHRRETYARKATEAHLSAEPSSARSELLASKAQLLLQTQKLDATLKSQLDETKKLQAEVEGARAGRMELERAVNSGAAKLDALRGEVIQVERDALELQVQLTLDADAVASQLAALSEKARKVEEACVQARSDFQKLEGQRDTLTADLNGLQQSIDKTTAELEQAKRVVREIEGLFAEQELVPEDRQTESRLAALSERRRLLDSLRDEVLRYEVMLDASETSAALARSRLELASLEEKLLVRTKEARQLTDMRSMFESIRDELASVQKRALDDYIDSFGPFASTIQSRLRPVYGFGQLRLTRKGTDKIRVEVERRGHRGLAPHAYYSESQLQVAMLSLFLSAALTQTWSPFAPILLDDPVTHFDDMNAYALLDLIKGLENDPCVGNRRRQFIVSTCEEKFYRLMRRKFSDMDAIFYEISSIGANGPVVSDPIRTESQ
jgi:exonuclease SbcC